MLRRFAKLSPQKSLFSSGLQKRFISSTSITPKVYSFDRIENPYFKEIDEAREQEIIKIRQQLSSPSLDHLVEMFVFIGEKRWAYNNGVTDVALEKYHSALSKHPKAEVAIIFTCQSDQLAKELSLKTPRDGFIVIGIKPPILTGLPIQGLNIDPQNVVDTKKPRPLQLSDFTIYKAGQPTEDFEHKTTAEEIIKNLELLKPRQ